MKTDINFRSFGMAEKDLESLAKIGIRYDKRSRAAYLSEFSSPSVAKEEDITEFELSHLVRFPDDYRSFLLTHNGGKPDRDMVFVQEHGWTTIQHFSPLVSRIASIELRHLVDVVYKGRMPEKHLPIATTPGGSWFILSLENEGFGKAYFWDHEREAIIPLPVANSFSDFLSMLKENDQSGEAHA